MRLVGVLAVLTSVVGCERGQVIVAQGRTKVLEKPIPEERFKIPRQEGDAPMEEPKLVATLDSGIKVRLLKTEYFKDYAAYQVELPDGRRGYVFHGDSILIMGTPSGEFWQAGRHYTIRMRVTNRAPLIPELERAWAPLSDTTSVALRLDSLARDSLYGTYEAYFRHFGVMVGAIGDAPQRFAGHLVGDSLEIELTPNATDAGLHLRGRRRVDGGFAGKWYLDQGSTSGTFALPEGTP